MKTSTVSSLWNVVEPILFDVQSPAQYTGGEWNSVRKNRDDVAVTVALAFPDAYKMGMGDLSFQTLYGLLNARADVACERAFAPWPDLESRLRQHSIPLFTLESHVPVKECDVILIPSLTPLRYTTVLHMLALAGLPLKSSERDESHPLVLAAGPAVHHPEPMADFVDAFLVGDPEAVIASILDARKGGDKKTWLRALAQMDAGVYVPAHRDKNSHPVRAAKIDSLDAAFYPTAPVVPFTEAANDRVTLEMMRSPEAFRTVEHLAQLADRAYRATGYDEIAMVSHGRGLYPHLGELVARMNARFKARRVEITLQPCHVREENEELLAFIPSLPRGSLVFELDAGTESLRQAIGNPIREDYLRRVTRAAFQAGWRHLRISFTIGWPGETEEDLRAIVDTARKVSTWGREVLKQDADVTVFLDPMTPAPHTALQWFPAPTPEYLQEVQQKLQRFTKGSRVHLKWSDAQRSYLETVLARGDRACGRVLEAMHRKGYRLNTWHEFFDFAVWKQAFEETGVDPNAYANRVVPVTEKFSWDGIETGVAKASLVKDFQKISAAIESRSAEAGKP